jgi:putative transposase
MKYNPLIHHRRSIRLKEYDYSQADSYFITICCQDMKCRFGHVGAPLAGALHADAQNADIAGAADIGQPEGQPQGLPLHAGTPDVQMQLNEYGTIAYNEWMKLPQRFPNFELDVFQIMPNHIHGIITLVGASLADAQNPDIADAQYGCPISGQPQGLPLPVVHDKNRAGRAGVNPAPTTASTAATIGDIVGAYKSLVSNACLKIHRSNHDKNRAGVNPAPTGPTMGKLWQRNYYEHIIRNERSYQNISNYIINNPAKWNEDKFYSK